MNETAYGFSSSEILKSSKYGNFLITTRNTRLFYPENYLDKDLMDRCVLNYSEKFKENSINFCLDKYNVDQIISQPNYLIDNKKYDCSDIKLKSGSRNPFNRFYIEQNYCIRKSVLKQN